jgi:hypothetical protein
MRTKDFLKKGFGNRPELLRTLRWLQFHPAFVIIVPGIMLLILFLYQDYKVGVESKDFYGNLSTSVIEVFLLGFVVIAYNKLGERKDRIKRYMEEIDSYRPWKEAEATYRICGLIRSLNNMIVSDIELNDCYLFKAPLREADLCCADLQRANLQEADLIDANLMEAFLRNANLQRVNLSGANLVLADLQNTDLEGANLWGADLRYANLSMANLSGVNLCEADLMEADLTCTNLSGANLNGANLNKTHLFWAIVESKEWIEKLEKCNIKGMENIREKYCVVEDNSNGESIFRIEEIQN